MVEGRLAIAWLVLLTATQFTDVLTTALDRARGAVESMPLTVAILAEGGLLRLAALKLLLVVGLGLGLYVSLGWKQRGSRAPFAFVISACRITAVTIALVSLQNALLFDS